jgi:hypothetical protein
MALWVREYGVRASGVFENLEITKNLPEAWRVQDSRAADARALVLTPEGVAAGNATHA